MHLLIIKTLGGRNERNPAGVLGHDRFLAKLIDAREEAGLTQREVAERPGMFHSWISKTESGDRRLDVMELMLLAELYGKAPEYFLQKDYWPQATPRLAVASPALL